MADLPIGTTDLIDRALAEDLGAGDVTSEATVPAGLQARARIIQKGPGVVFGLEVAAEVFRRVGVDDFELTGTGSGWNDSVPRDVALVRGKARELLAGERVALNFLGRLSGIATMTARYVQAVAGTGARILDTRKTTPGMRLLEKEAVAAGGGLNHRIGLFDAILIKENHIAMAGGVSAAIAACREGSPGMMVEVEAEDLGEVRAAIAAGADRILLDNMGPDRLIEAVSIRDRERAAVELEASGGINLGNVGEVAATGVDFISIGALTHSAPSLDVSLLLDPLS